MKVLRTKRTRRRMCIFKMKNKEGETVTEMKGIASIVRDFYQRLYSQSVPSPVGEAEPQVVLNVGSEDIPEIEASELRTVLKQIKNKKALAEDRVTSEMLKSDGGVLERALLVTQ